MADRPRPVINHHPLPKHNCSTRFLRVPVVDWPAVRLGIKTEFRTRPRESSTLLKVPIPTPVVAYSWTKGKFGDPSSRLMVLEDRRQEMLFEIANQPGSLAAEGFDSYDDFRRYWRGRTGGKFAAVQRVWVWRVRPFLPTEVEQWGVKLFNDLYGEYLS